MGNNLTTFKQEMDSWVKDFNSQLTSYKSVPSLLKEHNENIDHNYELLTELRSEVKRLKEELSAIRMVQLLHLRADVKQKN